MIGQRRRPILVANRVVATRRIEKAGVNASDRVEQEDVVVAKRDRRFASRRDGHFVAQGEHFMLVVAHQAGEKGDHFPVLSVREGKLHRPILSRGQDTGVAFVDVEPRAIGRVDPRADQRDACPDRIGILLDAVPAAVEHDEGVHPGRAADIADLRDMIVQLTRRDVPPGDAASLDGRDITECCVRGS